MVKKDVTKNGQHGEHLGFKTRREAEVVIKDRVAWRRRIHDFPLYTREERKDDAYENNLKQWQYCARQIKYLKKIICRYQLTRDQYWQRLLSIPQMPCSLPNRSLSELIKFWIVPEKLFYVCAHEQTRFNSRNFWFLRDQGKDSIKLSFRFLSF